jgi:hypothetical protein
MIVSIQISCKELEPPSRGSYTHAMAEILNVGPLPPTPEIFIKSLQPLFERARPPQSPQGAAGSPAGAGVLDIDMTAVFPFEDRRDGLSYDERVFDQLFVRRQAIRPVFRLDTPFRLPGREDWESGLDEDGSDGLPFLVIRLAAALEDMHALSGGAFAGVLLVSDGTPDFLRELCRRLSEETPYVQEQLLCVSSDEAVPASSAWPLLGSALWEEQLGGTNAPLTGRLGELDGLWRDYCLSVGSDAFLGSRATINSLRGRPRQEHWPFLPRAAGGPQARRQFERLTERCDDILRPRSEERWYDEFRLSLEYLHRSLSAGLDLSGVSGAPSGSPGG